MTSPIPTERDASVAAGRRRAKPPTARAAAIAPLVPLLAWVLHAWAIARATVLAARARVDAQDLDDHLATAPREDRYWPGSRRPVVQVPDQAAAAELDGPDYQGVLAMLLALGKVDAAAPADQVLLRAQDRAEDVHPRSLHLAATYLERELITMVRSPR